MTLKLDFTNKVVLIEENINIKELLDKLKETLPDWKEWSIGEKTIEIYDCPNWHYNPPYYTHTDITVKNDRTNKRRTNKESWL